MKTILPLNKTLLSKFIETLPYLKASARAIIVLFVVFDLYGLATNYPFALSQRAVRPVVEPGTEYNDFKSVLAEIPRIGFLTDKDMSPERNDGQFLAAQYI